MNDFFGLWMGHKPDLRPEGISSRKTKSKISSLWAQKKSGERAIWEWLCDKPLMVRDSSYIGGGEMENLESLGTEKVR